MNADTDEQEEPERLHDGTLRFSEHGTDRLVFRGLVIDRTDRITLNLGEH